MIVATRFWTANIKNCVYVYIIKLKIKNQDHSCMSDAEDLEGKIMYISKT